MDGSTQRCSRHRALLQVATATLAAAATSRSAASRSPGPKRAPTTIRDGSLGFPLRFASSGPAAAEPCPWYQFARAVLASSSTASSAFPCINSFPPGTRLLKSPRLPTGFPCAFRVYAASHGEQSSAAGLSDEATPLSCRAEHADSRSRWHHSACLWRIARLASARIEQHSLGALGTGDCLLAAPALFHVV